MRILHFSDLHIGVENRGWELSRPEILKPARVSGTERDKK